MRLGELRATAAVLGDAFMSEPVWQAIGPRGLDPHRRLANRVSFAGILGGSRRHGARIRVARAAGAVVGATVAFEPGRWPIPQTTAVWELAWLLVAGPRPALRALRDDAEMRKHHVEHPHMYLWFIGVAPSRHGSGIGRALLADVHEASAELGVPTYLETGSPENVGFYGRGGYEEVGAIAMPSGPTMWRMERPAEIG